VHYVENSVWMTPDGEDRRRTSFSAYSALPRTSVRDPARMCGRGADVRDPARMCGRGAEMRPGVTDASPLGRDARLGGSRPCPRLGTFCTDAAGVAGA
jgi:hypothetical protein